MTGSYLHSIPLGPIVRQKVDTAALGLAGSLLKVLPELVGVVDLETGSIRCQKVGEERSNEMRDRRVQEGNDRHTHHADLEGHESDIFALGVVNAAQALVSRRICCEAAGNSRGSDEVVVAHLVKKTTR